MKIGINLFIVLLLLQSMFGAKKLSLAVIAKKRTFLNRSNLLRNNNDVSHIWKNGRCKFEEQKNNIIKMRFVKFNALCKEPAFLNLFHKPQCESDLLKKINSIKKILDATGVILKLVKNDYMRERIKNIHLNMTDMFENLRLLGEFLEDHQADLTKLQPAILDAVVFKYVAKAVIENNIKLKFVISKQLNKISFNSDIYDEKQEIMCYFNKLDNFHFVFFENKIKNIEKFMKVLSFKYNKSLCKKQNETKYILLEGYLAELKQVTEDDPH
jgi:hypothetical protein